jgi:hypothetical protein
MQVCRTAGPTPDTPRARAADIDGRTSRRSGAPAVVRENQPRLPLAHVERSIIRTGFHRRFPHCPLVRFDFASRALAWFINDRALTCHRIKTYNRESRCGCVRLRAPQGFFSEIGEVAGREADVSTEANSAKA